MTRETIKISFDWEPLVPDDRGWSYIPRIPGVYRIEFGLSKGVYIGETSNLRQRMTMHRSASSKAVTPLRDLWLPNDQAGTLSVFTATNMRINRWKVHDLTLKLNRLMVESAAVVIELRRSGLSVINKGGLD